MVFPAVQLQIQPYAMIPVEGTLHYDIPRSFHLKYLALINGILEEVI